MKKLLTGVPQDSQNSSEQTEVTALQIEQAVAVIQKKVEAQLLKKSKIIQEELQSHVKSLQKLSENPSIFHSKLEFKFSTELKHTGVTVASDKIIKSS